jgi:hypothetical protein
VLGPTTSAWKRDKLRRKVAKIAAAGIYDVQSKTPIAAAAARAG